MLRIAICDDVKSIANEIQEHIKKWAKNKKIEIETYCTTTPLELINIVKRNFIVGEDIDIIFLDIQMPDQNGFELAKHILEIKPNTYIVFVTNFFYTEFVFNAFMIDASHFLLKENLESQLPKVLDFLNNSINSEDVITVKFDKTTYTLTLSEILHFQIEGFSIVAYMLHGKQIRFTANIDTLGKTLNNKGFIHCHKSHIVNTKYVISMKNNDLYLIDNIIIPISKSRYAATKNAYINILSKGIKI